MTDKKFELWLVLRLRSSAATDGAVDHLEWLVVHAPVDVQLRDRLARAVGHQIDVAPHVGNFDALQLGDVLARDVEGVGEVAVRDVHLDGEISEVLYARVVRVRHERLHRHDGVHGRNEATVSQPHRVQPLHDLVLRVGNCDAVVTCPSFERE